MSGHEYVTKDSGRRQEYSSGARRDISEGKGRFDLISGIALARLAKLLERGAEKYGDRNWEKGMPMSRYLSSASRHLYQLTDGLDDEDHAAAVLFNVMCFIHTLEKIEQGELPPELNDTKIKLKPDNLFKPNGPLNPLGG